ncbi:MAG: hypothetical protein A4E72_01407 [Syntrophus sp. PtaU1.Bin208]|nr:MAG: hypothetical protein A4E72_01407 [Syntrophus sp. PtaU1.Bin208]
MNDPVATWNILSTPVLITALGYFIKKLIDDTQETAKHRNEITTAELSAIKQCLTAIKIDMENRVERSECEKKGNQKWDVIYHHKHTESGEVVVPQ